MASFSGSPAQAYTAPFGGTLAPLRLPMRLGTFIACERMAGATPLGLPLAVPGWDVMFQSSAMAATRS